MGDPVDQHPSIDQARSGLRSLETAEYTAKCRVLFVSLYMTLLIAVVAFYSYWFVWVVPGWLSCALSALMLLVLSHAFCDFDDSLQTLKRATSEKDAQDTKYHNLLHDFISGVILPRNQTILRVRKNSLERRGCLTYKQVKQLDKEFSSLLRFHGDDMRLFTVVTFDTENNSTELFHIAAADAKSAVEKLEGIGGFEDSYAVILVQHGLYELAEDGLSLLEIQLSQ